MSKTREVRYQLARRVQDGATLSQLTEEFPKEGRRISEIATRFGLARKRLKPDHLGTRQVEQAIARLIALHQTPTPVLVNQALGRPLDVLIRHERFSEGKNLAELEKLWDITIREAGIKVLQEQLEAPSWGPLSLNPFGESRPSRKKRVVKRTGKNYEVIAQQREDDLFQKLQGLRPTAALARYTDNGCEALGADFTATENGETDFFDAKGWRRITANERDTMLANPGHYFILTDQGYAGPIGPEHLRKREYWELAPTRRRK
jgi:hypothetical protein